MSVIQKLNDLDLGMPRPLTLAEVKTAKRAIDVLRRIAENGCTNPQKEAKDILRQLDAG